MISWAKQEWESGKNLVTEMFSLDKRSLALFRVLIGVIILLDLYVRSLHLEDFYTDNGVLPGPIAMYFLRKTSGIGDWSIFFISGNYSFVALLFILNAIIAFALLIGYQTKASTLLFFSIFFFFFRFFARKFMTNFTKF